MLDAAVLASEKERQILAGAARIFAFEGYDGASMSQIAGEAGVSKGTLYNYFPSKAALFGTFVQRTCESELAFILDEPDDHVAAAEMLAEIGRRVIRLLLSEPALTIDRVVTAEATQFPELARLYFTAGPGRLIAYLAEWLRRRGTDCGIAIIDPELQAEQILSLLQTRVVSRRRLGLVRDVSDAEIENVVDAAVRLLLGRPPHRCIVGDAPSRPQVKAQDRG